MYIKIKRNKKTLHVGLSRLFIDYYCYYYYYFLFLFFECCYPCFIFYTWLFIYYFRLLWFYYLYKHKSSMRVFIFFEPVTMFFYWCVFDKIITTNIICWCTAHEQSILISGGFCSVLFFFFLVFVFYCFIFVIFLYKNQCCVSEF